MDGVKDAGQKPWDPFAALYERGMAYGKTDIRNDTYVFSYKGEKIELPTLLAYPVTKYNGYFYEAKIDDLRKLQEAMKKEK